MNKTIPQKIYFLPMLIWMIVIFTFSQMNGERSGGTSGGLINRVVTIAGEAAAGLGLRESTFSEEEKAVIVEKLQFPVRKCAHASEYFLLALLGIYGFRKNGMAAGKSARYALLMAALYSGTDEFHQLFIPGRAGQLRDCLIDTSGAAVGCLLFILLAFMRKHRK